MIKIHSGPGRIQHDLLATLWLIGVYKCLGVPNTTLVTQETDQNFGPSSPLSNQIWIMSFSSNQTPLNHALFNCISLGWYFGGNWSSEQMPSKEQCIWRCILEREIHCSMGKGGNSSMTKNMFGVKASPRGVCWCQWDEVNTVSCHLLSINDYDEAALQIEVKKVQEQMVTVPPFVRAYCTDCRGKMSWELILCNRKSAHNWRWFFKAATSNKRKKKSAKWRQTRRINFLEVVSQREVCASPDQICRWFTWTRVRKTSPDVSYSQSKTWEQRQEAEYGKRSSKAMNFLLSSAMRYWQQSRTLWSP